MSRPKLTTTQHLVLAVVARRGPCTPYELKDYFGRVVRYLVEVPHTLLYTELPKLAGLGLVHEDREETGRRRKTYTITDDGMDVVRAWVEDPHTREPSLEDEAIMKLIHGAFGSPEAVAELANRQVAYFSERIAAIDAAMALNIDVHRNRYFRSAVRLARAQSEVLVEFWSDIERDPDREGEVLRSSGPSETGS